MSFLERRRRRDPLRAESGATAVEFALILPLFLTLVMGAIDWGYFFYVQQVVTNAVREGARAGTVVDPGTDFEHENQAKNEACAATWAYLVGAGLVSAAGACGGVGSGNDCAKATVTGATVCAEFLEKGSGAPCITGAGVDANVICAGVALPIGNGGSLSGMLPAIMPDAVRARAFMRWD